MKRISNSLAIRTLLGLLLAFALHASVACGAEPGGIASRKATIDSLEIHYLTAGQGPTVILLHGYAETSRMWRLIILQDNDAGLSGTSLNFL